MLKEAKNKNIGSEVVADKGTVGGELKTYFYPKHQKSVKAYSQKEADAKLQELLKKQK